MSKSHEDLIASIIGDSMKTILLEALTAADLCIVPRDVVEALRSIRDHDSAEINVSNYDHDDVCKLNAANIEIYEIAATALAKLEDAA